MRYFLYYSDEYWENGGVGFASFNTKEQAEDYIALRSRTNKATIESYRLIEGREMTLTAKEVIQSVEAA